MSFLVNMVLSVVGAVLCAVNADSAFIARRKIEGTLWLVFCICDATYFVLAALVKIHLFH